MIICFRFVFPILYSIIFFFIISKITNLHSSFNFNLLLIFFFIFPNLLSISVSFLKKNPQKNILTLLISTIISFYLVEGILAYYFVNFNNLNLESKSKKKIEFDKRSLLEFLESYKAKNNEVVPYFTSENLIKEDISLLPLSGISNSTTAHCNESGFYSVYQSDRYGFNNPDIIWESSKRKIFLFGDSFVHGSCVNYNETIAEKNLFGIEKLNIKRSDIPAVTHVDYSARVQTVHKDTNLKYYNLIKKFKELIGCPVLVNTSFNVRGEPIVNSPKDAFDCFMGTGLDYLIIGNFILDKKKQDNNLIKDYKNKFNPD